MKLLHNFFYFIVLLPVVFGTSCKSDSSKTKETDPQAADTAQFYPLGVYFKEQVDYVALRDFPLYKITVKDGKKDSVTISKDEFIAAANTFTRYDISSPETKALYRETSFEDLSTSSLTLNYKPVDKNAVVENIDILMDQEGHRVKRVFIRAAYKKGDTTISEQCSWKSDKSFQVNRFIEAGNYKSTELTFINWNDTP